MARIIILTGPVQSGKTTWLMNWLSDRNDVSGFLCPDIEGKRCFLQIEDKIMLPLEVKESTKESTITIGRFVFFKKTFDVAKDWLLNSDLSAVKWIVIDEIGKLELEDKGFEPEFSHFLKRVSVKSNQVSIIIVVRDYLLELICKKYSFENVEILQIQNIMDQSDFSI